MRLLIKRNQPTHVADAVRFELQAKTQLTPEEADLVEAYDLGRMVVLKTELQAPVSGQPIQLLLKIKDLIDGRRFDCNDIAEVLETENSVKQACENFRGYLQVMENFDSEQVLEYPMTHVAPSGERVVQFDVGVTRLRTGAHDQSQRRVL